MIERGVVLARGAEITPELLPTELRTGAEARPTPGLREGTDFARAVTDFERGLIEAAMKQAGGVQKKAASLLGLKPTTLNEKLKRLRVRAGAE